MSTHNILFSIYKKANHHNYPKSAAMRFFQGTQERLRNGLGKRAISVGSTEVLLYILMVGCSWFNSLYRAVSRRKGDRLRTYDTDLF